MGNEIQILSGSQGECLAVAGGNYRVLVSGEQTSGSYAVIEMNVPPGGGPPPHSHPLMAETFYLVEGELEFKTESGSERVREGGFVRIPLDGGVHCFRNVSGKVAKMLCTVVPSGLEVVFRQIGVPVKVGEFLPPPAATPERIALLEKIDREHGQKTYPRDYLD